MVHWTVSKRFKFCFEERMTGCHNVNNVIRNCSSLRHFLISNFFLNSVQTQTATSQLWYIFAILRTFLYIHTPLPASNMKVIPEEMTSLFDINMSTLSYLKTTLCTQCQTCHYTWYTYFKQVLLRFRRRLSILAVIAKYTVLTIDASPLRIYGSDLFMSCFAFSLLLTSLFLYLAKSSGRYPYSNIHSSIIRSLWYVSTNTL